MTTTDPALEDAAAAGLTDSTEEPEAAPEAPAEKVTPEIVDVDTSAPKADVDDVEVPADAEVHHLPVRHEVAEHPTLGTLVPLQEEMRGVAQLAVTLATSKLVPKALQDKPADVLAIILTGRELGVAPMTAVRMFHVIGGTVTLAPKVRMAMVRTQGLGKVYPHQPPSLMPCPLLAREGHDDGDPCRLCAGSGVVQKLCPCGNPSANGCEGDPDQATWHAERHDTPGVIFTSTYTTAMAMAVTYTEWEGSDNNRRKVEKKLGEKDNWKNYPAQMCQWRALGYLMDQAFSEVGTGLYQPDEVGAVTDDQGEPILDVASTEVIVPADNSPAAQAKAKAEAARANKPPDPPASPDTIATFKDRIDKIKRYEGADIVLGNLWLGRREKGDPAERLPKVEDLLYRQCKLAAAVLDMVERRCKAGEFGEERPAEEGPKDEHLPAQASDQVEGSDSAPSVEGGNEEQPDGPDAATEAPDSPQEGQEPPPALPPTEPRAPLPFDIDELRRTASGDSTNDDMRWVVKAPDNLASEVAAEVKGLKLAEVDSRCKALKVTIRGSDEPTKRARLSAKLIRHRMERMAEA